MSSNYNDKIKQMTNKVTVVTASTGKPHLEDCVRSIKYQSYPNIQHLIFADGNYTWGSVSSIVADCATKYSNTETDIIKLPYPTGADRWNGHRMYGAGTYLAEGDYIMFLDDDNYLEPEHIEKCLEVIKSGKDWSYSLRTLVGENRKILGKDNCESLGKWASVLHPEDYFIDVNCYFLPRLLSVQISPIWFCKFREPGQPEIDRKICHALRQIAPNFDCTYNYSVNYRVGNTGLSVQPEFFEKGNAEMLKRYKGKLPWVK